MTGFDPAKYITKVSGRDYLEVKWRLVWARTEHPELYVETELVRHEKNEAIFRAKVGYHVRLPDSDGVIQVVPVSCTGWGSEASDDFVDYLEKAETKALGRALAAAGYGTQFCQDFEFGADQQRVVDSPVDFRGGGRGTTGGRQEATPRQVKYLHAVARELGVTEADLTQRSLDSFGEEIHNLSRRDVSTLIEQLQAERPVIIGSS